MISDIDSICRLFLDELDFVEKNSYFSHQNTNSPDDCGFLVEHAIRKFFQEIVGDRFKVTHGYILSPNSKKLSGQVDIMITDTLVPNRFKQFDYLDGLEIVPAESVVAIFEVKRTLRSSALREATMKLKALFHEIPLCKDSSERYLSGGMQLQGNGVIKIDGGKTTNCLIGIISLLKQDSLEYNMLPWFIDIVCSFQGLFYGPKDKNGSYCVYPIRSQNEQVPFEEMNDENNRIIILKHLITYIIKHLTLVSGRTYDPNKYFF